MLSLLWPVFHQVCLPIFVLTGFGWLLDHRFRLDLGSLVKLNIYLVVPAFIFVQVVSAALPAGVAVRVVLFTLAVIGAMFVLSEAAGRLCRYPVPQQRSLQLATMFYNSGNFGVPLMALAYPVSGPLLQVFALLTMNVTTFSVGLGLAASAHRPGWRSLLPVLRQVSIWAVVAALVVRWQDIPVQSWPWLWVPLRYLSDALVAFALVTLGVQLSQTEHDARNLPRLSWALGLRLLGGPLVALALVRAFGFEGETARVMILSSSFPTAVNTALLAHEFKADHHFAASAVFYSTLASMFTVTLLIALLRFA